MAASDVPKQLWSYSHSVLPLEQSEKAAYLAISGLMGPEDRAANLDGVAADEAHDAHRARLAKAVHARERLLLHRHIQRRLQQEHVACCRRAGTPSLSGVDEYQILKPAMSF